MEATISYSRDPDPVLSNPLSSCLDDQQADSLPPLLMFHNQTQKQETTPVTHFFAALRQRAIPKLKGTWLRRVAPEHREEGNNTDPLAGNEGVVCVNHPLWE